MKAQAKRRMGHGALPWPEQLLRASPAANAPQAHTENTDPKWEGCRGGWLKARSKNVPGLVLDMLQNAGGGLGLLSSSLNLYLSGAGFGQGWLMHFVKGTQWKQDGETRATQAWNVLLCPAQPFFPSSDLAHHPFPKEVYSNCLVLPACSTESQSQG